MYSSKDGLVKVSVTPSLTDVVFPESDWSVIVLPGNEEEALAVLENLYNSPSQRHLTLLLTRGKPGDRVGGLGAISKASLSFLDSVTILYEKASSGSANRLLPISEPGWLLYKGDMVPDISKTEWFGEETANATSHWDLTAQQHEPNKKTSYPRFSWDMNLLLLSMMQPLRHRRFVYTPTVDSDAVNLAEFCRRYNVEAQLYAPSDEKAKALIEKIG